MAITRTIIVDDDGSSTTGTIFNNAWKQELYNQIDGTLGPGVPFTMVDASGAGLTFAGQSCFYVRYGSLLVISGNITYPATASPAGAKVAGFPVLAGYVNYSGGFSTYGTARMIHINPAGVLFFMTSAGAGLTNADLSGQSTFFVALAIVAAGG